MEAKKSKDILGIYPGHDSTVVLLRGGKFMEAMSEERLSRFKKHFGFPDLALSYLKRKYKLGQDLAVYLAGKQHIKLFLGTLSDNEFLRNHQSSRLWFVRAILSKFFVTKILLKTRDDILSRIINFGTSKKYFHLIQEKLNNIKPLFIDHHEAHAWATVAFMPRDNKPRIIITLDGEGDGFSGSISIYCAGKIDVRHKFPAKHSLGLLYCGVVDILGMRRNEHEFKVMGLAPYAKASSGDKVYEELRQMIWFDDEAMSFETSFDMHGSTAELVVNEMTTRHRFDSIAYGIQKLTEELIKQIALAAINKYGISDLALGGGVFMNVKANQRLMELPEVSSVVVTPSCGDESLALGSAIYGYSQENKNDLSELETLSSLYLGSCYTDQEIGRDIANYSASKDWKIEYFDPDKDLKIEKKVAQILADNGVVGRFKGRAEWGARALGNRSILANPSSRDNVKLINEMIKGRDFWMPFATSMLHERVQDYLVNPRNVTAPFMAVTFDTKPLAHSELLAALHPYDLTSRPQMVRWKDNPDYHTLISEFEKITGIGGILNTSFNLHGEPNVERPVDALRTFELSGLPYLAIGNYLCSKIKR